MEMTEDKQLKHWLEELGLVQYADMFWANDVGFRALA